MTLAARGALFWELTKPRLTALVLVTTAVGYWMAAPGPISWPRLSLLVFLAGCVAGGVNALNQWWERDHDALMRRTQNRPLPRGLLRPNEALIFGLALVLAGCGAMDWLINRLSAVIALISAISYVVLYTPLKRRTALCTLVGAIPGAFPVLIGWAAARGSIGPEGWVLFGILFLWQLPHFLALALMLREDYQRAGYCMLPLVPGGERITARQMVLYTTALVPLSLMPTLMGLTGAFYFAAALLLGLAFGYAAWQAARAPGIAVCRKVFFASIAYLPLLMLVMAADKR